MTTPNLDCLQFQTVPPGGIISLPPGATLVYHNEGGILTSECDSIQAQIDSVNTATTCQYISWQLEYDQGGGSGAWKASDIRIKKIGFGKKEFAIDLNGSGFSPDGPYTNSTLKQEIQSKFPFLLYVDHITSAQVGERREFKLSLLIPDVFKNAFFVEFDHYTEGGITPARFYAIDCADCCQNLNT